MGTSAKSFDLINVSTECNRFWYNILSLAWADFFRCVSVEGSCSTDLSGLNIISLRQIAVDDSLSGILEYTLSLLFVRSLNCAAFIFVSGYSLSSCWSHHISSSFWSIVRKVYNSSALLWRWKVVHHLISHSLKSLSKVSQKCLKGLQQLCTALKTLKSKDELLTQWVSDRVTYWAVLDS